MEIWIVTVTMDKEKIVCICSSEAEAHKTAKEIDKEYPAEYEEARKAMTSYFPIAIGERLDKKERKHQWLLPDKTGKLFHIPEWITYKGIR